MAANVVTRASRFGVTSLGHVLVLGLMNFPLLRALALPLTTNSKKPEGKSPEDPTLWIYLGVAFALVLGGGVFAGLTIALMGQDEIYLEVLHDSGDENEKKHAGKVLRLLKRGKHWVLVTLLLSNVITNETLPIVLDRSLGGGWPAVVSSTALIVIFGEVIPQSICVRYGLSIGAYLSSTVLVLMYIMSPIAWPTAKLLDYLLGEDHGTVYKKAGLKTLVTLHASLGKTPGERLNEDEVTIITAVLDLKAKNISSIMTPINDVFTMPSDKVLDQETVDGILAAGYSRIPIHTPDNPVNFIGMLLVRMLITYDPEDCVKVSDMALATLPETKPETSCLDVINFFQEGKSHMLVVSQNPGEKDGALGVVTLEDVIEELIGEEIIDESDVYIDNERTARRKFSNASQVVKPHDLKPHDPKESQADLTFTGPANGHTDTSSPVFAPPRRRSTNLSLRHTLMASSNKNARARSRSPAPGAGGDHKDHKYGPSNLASKPTASKNAKIKIKPGKEEGKSTGIDGDLLAATEGVREAAVNESSPLLGGSRQ